MLGLLTALEGAGSPPPGVFALLVPGRWSGASREPPVCPWPSKRMPPPVTWRCWVVVCWDGRGSSTETEARSSALSLDLVAPRASSPATTLPTASPPPTVGSGSGGRDADGPATSEAFFFGAMVLLLTKLTNSERLMKNAPARTPDQVRTTSTPPTWRAKDVGESAVLHEHLWDRSPFVVRQEGGGCTKSRSRRARGRFTQVRAA